MVYTEFYDVVERRRSIKKYSDRPIEKEKLYRILQTSTLIPSWSCKHCWRFLIIDDRELIWETAECIDEANPVKKALFEAPAVVVICGDPENTEEIDEKEYYMADCGIAMGYFMLSACNEGLSTCWIGLFNEDELKNVLDIPEHTRIVAISPLGYGSEPAADRPGKSIKDIAFHDKWDMAMVFK